MCYTLKDLTQWSVISGPLNFGKSTLLLEAVNILKEEKRDPSIIHLDLRSRTFRDVDTFASTMVDELSSWFTDLLKSFKKIGVKMGVSDVEVELMLAKGGQDPTKKLQELFDILSRALPNWSWLRGYDIPPPILIIDEANRLHVLLDDTRGNTVLNDFFAWIVLNTKQKHQFHVVTASSDSFYHRWLARYVDGACFQNFVIGHLSKEEAKKFWEQEVVGDRVVRDQVRNASPLTLEDAYKVCGGCMHLMAETYKIFNAV